MIGDKVLVDYGGVVLTVIGFESEEKYLSNKRKKRNKEFVNNLAVEDE
jgi:hypothetical protein